MDARGGLVSRLSNGPYGGFLWLIKGAYYRGILSGLTKSTHHPSGPLLRSQAADQSFQKPFTEEQALHDSKNHPGEPVAQNYGLLETNNGLLWAIVAYYFQLLGCPGLDHLGTIPFQGFGSTGMTFRAWPRVAFAPS